MSSGRLKALAVLVAAGLAAAGIAVGSGGDGDEPPADEAATGFVPASDAEAGAISLTLDLIETGALPYEEDGQTFQNREGLLPDRPLGYYREYTVPTPGSPDRGARRLVIGEGGETYYTDDHYASFEEIDPGDYR